MNTFQPKFELVKGIDVCADMINLPHEDYPQRVSNTKGLIEYFVAHGYTSITEFDTKVIHSMIMHDLSDQSQRGCWRTSDVIVGYDSTTPPHMIADEVMEQQLFPVCDDLSHDELIDWYRRFQIIHPFLDGNGRVGGIIVAALTYNKKTDMILAPKQ